MKPICIIPARSGSKGLPNKNMLFLDGKPLIFHTIQAAIDSKLFDLNDIYVSTDSELYAEICRELGITALLRSEELSSDTATTYDLLEDFLNAFSEEQDFVLLQVTSPLRTSEQICQAYKLFKESHCDNVVSVSQVDKSPKMFSRLSPSGMLEDIVGVDKGYRRQNSEVLYYPNGAIYISKKSTYLSNSSFFTPLTKAYFMEKKSSVDIDDITDFVHAIGLHFFDYHRREQRSKGFYQQWYNEHYDQNANKAIIGDSRLVDISIPGYTNYAVGGVTLSTFNDNFATVITDNIKEVFVSIGVNDFIAKYPRSVIENQFEQLLERLSDKKVYVSTIPLTLFRAEVDNDDILSVNTYLKQLCFEKGISILEVNDYISEDNHLRYALTTDGLHFNSEAQLILEEVYTEFLKV